MEIYSHPGILLKKHLRDVGELIEKHLNSTHFSEDFPICIEDLKNIGYLIGVFHDFGKFSSFFQRHLKTSNKDLRSHHSCISAFICSKIIEEYIKNSVNSDSIILKCFPGIGYMIIRHHHGSLLSYEDDLNERSTNSTILSEWGQIPTILKDLREENRFVIICKIYKELLGKIKPFKSFDFENWFTNEFNTFLNSDFFKNFKNYIKKIRINLQNVLREESLNYFIFILIQYLYSILIESDRYSIALTDFNLEDLEFSLDIDEYKRKHLFSDEGSINHLREKFYEEIINYSEKELEYALNNKKHIYAITGPTGIGKTLAVLKFVELMKNKIKKRYNYIPQVLYFLPFTSIIDQNHKKIEEIFRLLIDDYEINKHRYLIKHHHLSELSYTKEGKEVENEKALLLVEAWEAKMIISTFYQFFHTIFGYSNSMLIKFNKIVNSIIILDEVQCFPPEYWIILQRYLITLQKFFNTKIILLTATQPAIFNENEIEWVIKEPEKYFSEPALNRIDFYFNLKNERLENRINSLLEDFFTSKKSSLMFVVNTIKESLNVANITKNYIENLSNKKNNTYSQTKLIYLSTNIIPKERKERIEQIKKFQRNKGNSKLIIITTQLIEAGVDIDIDIVIRDFGPMDCIIQVAGRCNRNKNQQKGIYKVYKFINLEGDSHSKPFCEYIYSPTLISITQNILKDFLSNNKLPFQETLFKKISDKYFKNVRKEVSNLTDFENILKYLKFKSIKKGDRYKIQSISDFKIISEDYQKEMVYIPMDGSFKNLYNEFRKILEQIQSIRNNGFNTYKKKSDYYNLKIELKKIQNKMKEYVIEIPKHIFNKLKDQKIIDEFNVIKEEDVDNYYDPFVGFLRDY